MRGGWKKRDLLRLTLNEGEDFNYDSGNLKNRKRRGKCLFTSPKEPKQRPLVCILNI